MLKLADTIASERFEAVAPERAQFVEARRGVDNFKAAISLSRETLKFPDKAPFGERQRTVAPVAQDHGIAITRCTMYVKH